LYGGCGISTTRGFLFHCLSCLSHISSRIHIVSGSVCYQLIVIVIQGNVILTQVQPIQGTLCNGVFLLHQRGGRVSYILSSYLRRRHCTNFLWGCAEVLVINVHTIGPEIGSRYWLMRIVHNGICHRGNVRPYVLLCNRQSRP